MAKIVYFAPFRNAHLKYLQFWQNYKSQEKAYCKMQPLSLEQKWNWKCNPFSPWNWLNRLHHFILPQPENRQYWCSNTIKWLQESDRKPWKKDRGNMVKIIEVHCCHMCKRFWLITGAIYDQFVEGISSNISTQYIGNRLYEVKTNQIVQNVNFKSFHPHRPGNIEIRKICFLGW